jgi:hypothetical protein
MKQNTNSTDLLRTDRSHIELAYVMYYYFDQENADSLISLLREYATYPKEILDRVQFIVVDDGSPIQVDHPDDLNLNILFMRIDTNIAWNQPGARNLGVTMARADKVFTTDLDHKLPVHTFRHLLERPNPGKNYLKMQRLNEEGKDIGYHLNTLFFSRATCDIMVSMNSFAVTTALTMPCSGAGSAILDHALSIFQINTTASIAAVSTSRNPTTRWNETSRTTNLLL